MSDPADITAPKDPAAYRPARLMGPGFWVMMAFGLICILAGIGVATLGPKLFGTKPRLPASAPPAEAVSPAPAAVVTLPAPDAVAAPPAGPTADLSRFDDRLDALESRERASAQAASTALAAAALVEASQGSRPFVGELAALRAASPSAPELAGLARLAEVGAPSRAALSATFPEYAAHAASAIRAPGEGAGLGARVSYAISKIVTLRRVGEVAGDSPDAQLARAETLVEDGELDQALRVLDRLPAPARDAMAPWRARAERRAEIDRAAASLRARALQELAQASRGAT